MPKTDWNTLLGHYKGTIYNVGSVIRDAIYLEAQGESVAFILGKMAIHYPIPKKLELNSFPSHYYCLEPKGMPFEKDVYAQMDMAARLPVFAGGALMPDAHPGFALPVGGVVVLRGAISPSFVGPDIACRMTFSQMDLFQDDIPKVVAAIKKAARFGFEVNDGENLQWHPVLDNPLWSELPHLRTLRDKARIQLGTSGAGNHFIDLMYLPASDSYGILTHSGSRGVGFRLAQHYIKLAAQICPADVPSDYAYLPMDTAEGQEYFAVMQLMGEYAQACHHIIHAKIHLACLLDGLNILGMEGKFDFGDKLEKDIVVQLDGIQTEIPLTFLENHHNFAWKEKDWDGNDLYIHRKGATPAAMGQWGIIPGSSGSNSYIVEGKQSPVGRSYDSASWNSASHGAGRPYSRTQAKKQHDAGRVAEHYAALGIETWGVAPDETVFAYKDIREVMKVQSQRVQIKAVLQPVFVAMGGLGNSDDGD